MGRKKKNIESVIENQTYEAEINENDNKKEPKTVEIEQKQSKNDDFDAPGLPQKDLFRVDEVARYLGITERCVRLWVENGHLEAMTPVGIIRITRRSIITCLKNPRLKINKNA